MRKTRKYGYTKPPKLGQHFLREPSPARKLAKAAGIRPSDMVLEIGPGTGMLTRELLAVSGHVIAIEKDSALAGKLRETFEEELATGQLTIIEQDIRDFDPQSAIREAREYVVAANIPYYITGEILRAFLSAASKPRTMALLVQKEVAERICASSGGGSASGGQGKESILSLSVKAYGTPKVVAKVPRGSFVPPPSVDSAILVVEDISRSFFSDIDEVLFFKIVRAGFSQKRKLLMSNLISKFGFTKPKLEETFSECRVAKNVRAEDVSLKKWKCLAQHLEARS